MLKSSFFRKKQCFLPLLFLFFIIFCFSSFSVFAQEDAAAPAIFAEENPVAAIFPTRDFYVGVNLGGGSTEWKYLVDTTDKEGPTATAGETPLTVNEGGPAWGAVVGYLVGKNFAIELQYMDFANSTMTFENLDIYTTLVNCTSTTIGEGTCSMTTKTDAFSLSGKFLVQVGKTHVRAFGSIGAGLVQRKDAIADTSGVAPFMAAGLDYNFTRNWVLESGFQYYTGFGASETNPADNFVPFAWDAYGRLAYQF